MEQIIQQLPYGVTINEMAAILQEHLIVKDPDIIIYAINDLYIYSVKNLETLRDSFMYENLEMVMESDKFWVLRSKPKSSYHLDIYINIDRNAQPKTYTFFRLDAVNTVLRA